MKNGIVAIYDSNVDYLHHLSEYLRLRDDFPYDIIVFNDLDAFNKYSLGTIDILITSFIPDFIKEKDIGDIFYLTVDDYDTYEDYVCLSKYQPADILLRKIMEKSDSCLKRNNLISDESCKIIGVYSPVSRCGKTSLSISIGTRLSENEPTLLISFDTFSVLKDFINDNSFRDISDLLFYFKENKDCLNNKLLSLTYKFYELNFICPPVTPERIKTTDTTTWCQLIKAVSHSGLYKNIIFDISDSFPSSEDFFKLCDIIYMPYLTDYVSMKKVDSFFEYISHTTNLDENLFKRITLPICEPLSTKGEYINWLKEVAHEHSLS